MQSAKKITENFLNSMPECNYDFKPTSEVRTFAEQKLHIANANYSFISTAVGQTNPISENLSLGYRCYFHPHKRCTITHFYNANRYHFNKNPQKVFFNALFIVFVNYFVFLHTIEQHNALFKNNTND